MKHLLPLLTSLLALLLACEDVSTSVRETSPTVAAPTTPSASATSAVAAPIRATQTPIPKATSVPEPTPTPELVGPIVRVGGVEIPVEVADTPQRKLQGLSDRLVLPADTGMLFPYERQSRYNFWMKNMHFPLDIVWIGADCKVVDVTLNAPPPEPGQAWNELPLFSPKLPAQYVLEINAGEAQAKSIAAGSPVEFAGIDGC